MQKLTKIDSMRAINARLADVRTSTEGLTLAEKQSLLSSLELDVAVHAAKEDSSKRRITAVKAAAASSDMRKKSAFLIAVAGLEKLGFEIEQIAASGSIADLDAKMREHKWSSTRKVALKNSLAIIGAV
jgi:hypothetical protein